MHKKNWRDLTRPGKTARLSFYILLAGLLFAPSLSQAQLAATESLGVRRCSDLVEAQKNNADLYAGFGAWIGGYLSAANAYEANTFDLTPWQPLELITAQITAACAKKPDEPIVRAVVSYVRFMHPGRLKNSTPLVRAQVNDSVVFIYRSVLTDVRNRLTALGQQISDPSGEFGESFAKSLRAFQERNGLPKSGLPDTQTMIHLYSSGSLD